MPLMVPLRTFSINGSFPLHKSFCFCAGDLAGLGLSLINRYNTKTPSRWWQFAVLMSDSLNHSFKWFIQKQIHSGMKHCSEIRDAWYIACDSHVPYLRCTNVLIQLCLELFSLVKQKENRQYCLKIIILIMSWFFELLYQSQYNICYRADILENCQKGYCLNKLYLTNIKN